MRFYIKKSCVDYNESNTEKGNEKPTKSDCNWFSVYLIVFAGSTLSSFWFKSIFSTKFKLEYESKFHDYFCLSVWWNIDYFRFVFLVNLLVLLYTGLTNSTVWLVELTNWFPTTNSERITFHQDLHIPTLSEFEPATPRASGEHPAVYKYIQNLHLLAIFIHICLDSIRVVEEYFYFYRYIIFLSNNHAETILNYNINTIELTMFTLHQPFNGRMPI